MVQTTEADGGAHSQVEDLAKLDLFLGADLSTIAALLRDCAVAEVAPGTVIVEQGSHTGKLYLVLGGCLTVHLGDPATEPLAHLRTGQSVGEMSMIDALPASATVVAAEPTRLLAIDRPLFWSLIRASPEFSINLLIMLAGRLRATNTTVTDTVALKNQAEQESLVDRLTGLYNRRWLEEKVPYLITRAIYGHEPLSVLMADIDYFKQVNDAHGHGAGDAVLATIGRLIARKMRPTDFGVRYGGEEFAVILLQTPLKGAVVAGERLRAMVEQATPETTTSATRLKVTISVGVAQVAEGEDWHLTFERADAALYQAKRAGRNRVVTSHGELPHA
jgi:diguanylate cyclase (GGDEF)-like protein